MMTNSLVTSYSRLFDTVRRVEIPLIQRDYAQGRGGADVERIRAGFLGVLHAAVTGGEPVSLDFVYGDVVDGTLRPLDGQQRLTTLFLLHWYLAARAGRLAEPGGWKQFSYATRASARLFCEELVRSQPPEAVPRLSAWLVDEAWFLYTWRHDPTVQSMLVMLDAIHERFRQDDCAAAWSRLADAANPPIVFHLLPVEGMELGEDLYIKMNSRGKPLTPFETFKARFLKLLASWCHAPRVQEVALKLDGAWSDVFWAYRGDDDIVDDELMRYFHFLMEICEWQRGRVSENDADRISVEIRAERVFGSENANREEHLAFLVAAFDTWVVSQGVSSVFDGLFTKSADGTGRVVLFGVENVDLFHSCVRRAGEWSGTTRAFTLNETLFLHAVLLARTNAVANATRSLRVVRNLIEASSNEIRNERMPGLLEDLRRIVVDGSLEGVKTFNTAQIADERRKAQILAARPDLESTVFKLEDHPILRGALAVFDLDAETLVLQGRAQAFERVFADRDCWPALTGALLAVGDYSRQWRATFWFGSGFNELPWRTQFTGSFSRSPIDRTRDVLGRFLDEVARDGSDHRVAIERIQREWLAAQTAYDWRYYFIKYPVMRDGRSGMYVNTIESMGFDVCMLDKTRLSSWYRDPFLHAIWRASGVGAAVEKPVFTGWATTPRWMELEKSGAAMRSVPDGVALRRPNDKHAETFDRVCERHGVGNDLVLRIPQVENQGVRRDGKDRIALSAALLVDLVASGL